MSCLASHSNRSGRVDRQPALVQRAAGPSILVGGEELEHVRAVVVLLLVDAPCDPGLGQPLGIRLPRVGRPGRGARHDVRGDRAAVRARRVDRPGPEVHAVGPGRPEQRAVVVIAERERLGEREVERDVLALVVAHHVPVVGGAVRDEVARDPVVVQRCRRRAGRRADRDVQRLVLEGPRVRRRRDRLRARALRVEMPRQQVAVWVVRVVLEEDRLALDRVKRRRGVGLDQRVRIAEPGDPGERAEIVIERSVLLHVDDDVLDVLAASLCAAPRRRRGREPAAEARRRARRRPPWRRSSSRRRRVTSGMGRAPFRVGVRRSDGRPSAPQPDAGYERPEPGDRRSRLGGCYRLAAKM